MSEKARLSVVLLTRNEESYIKACLESVEDIAAEIIILDESSEDKTVEIARGFDANVFIVKHEDNFHINKQKAIEKATGDWVLQLDADERVTRKLASEIITVINSNNRSLLKRVLRHPERMKKVEGFPDDKKLNLFAKHQKLIEQREGTLGNNTGDVAALFIPRVNYFLGKPLIHAGVYPDGVIRLFKNGKAKLPARSVHELMEVDGQVGWLFNDLEHHESPTLRRYIERMNRYTDLHAEELKQKNTPRNYLYLFNYSCLVPTAYFLKLYFRHKGFLDGKRGFLWSALSSLHFPIAYFKY